MCKFEKQLRKQPPHIRSHFNEVCNALKLGINPLSFGAKYLECFKDGIRRLSVRLSRSRRMILQETKGGLIPVWIGNHNEYDKWIRR